jgi:hypothetical protein
VSTVSAEGQETTRSSREETISWLGEPAEVKSACSEDKATTGSQADNTTTCLLAAQAGIASGAAKETTASEAGMEFATWCAVAPAATGRESIAGTRFTRSNASDKARPASHVPRGTSLTAVSNRRLASRPRAIA